MRRSEMKASFIKSLFVIVAALFFYTNIPTYFNILEYSSITPLIWISLLAVVVVSSLMLKFLVRAKATQGARVAYLKPVLYWIFFYIVISLLWLLFFDQTEFAVIVFRRRVLSTIFLSLFLVILYDDEDLQIKVRWVLLAAVLIAIIANIYDVIVPFTFVPLTSEFSNPGRAAGFYVNANQAGAALIMGMIFTVGLLSKKLRIYYVFLVFIGVLLTFSRAALMGWLLVVLILLFQNMFSKRQFLVGLCIMALMVMVSLSFMDRFLQLDGGADSFNISDISERMDWFLNPTNKQDETVAERKAVLELSWKMFAEHPLIGNGIGSTEAWSESVSTHNMYLYFMADHGISGFFIFPLLVLALVWRVRGTARQTALPFLAFILFWGFFSHNVIQEYYLLISFSLMASMTITSRVGNGQSGVELAT